MRFFVALVTILVILFPVTVEARSVSNVHVTQLSDGYEIQIEFYFPIQYQSYAFSDSGQELRVQLRPANFQQLSDQQIDDLRERVTLSWEQTSGVPLQEITMEGGDPERPQITFSFTKEVELSEVRNGDNPREIIVRIKTDVMTPSYYKFYLMEFEPPPPLDIKNESLISSVKLFEDLIQKNDFSQAVKVIRTALDSSSGKDRQQLAAWLGYALEKNGELARAKSVYAKYIKEYPNRADNEWVFDRFNMIFWAEEGIKQEEAAARRLDKLMSNVFGTVSEFFYRDQTTPQGSNTQINRNELLTSFDLNHRSYNSRWDIRTQMTGFLKNALYSRGGEDGYISNLSFETRHKKSGWYGKFGRQFRYTSGALDIFDGAHLAYDLSSKVTVNTVFGFPVTDTSVKEFDGDRKFQGVSFDFGTFNDRLDFTTYFLNQTNHGYVDRRAVGGEMRYFESNRFLSSLIDYDVFYERVNIFNINGWQALTPKTSLNLSYDYRNEPGLTTNNALLGQTETELSHLLNRLSKDEVFQLAQDRSMVSKSLSGSLTQTLKKDVQLTGGVTVYEAEGTVASGGVDAVEGAGYDLFYYTQLTTYNTFKKNDIVITGFNLDDVSSYYVYGALLSYQFPLTRNFKLIPSLRFNYRDYKKSDDARIGVRPSLRGDYKIKKWLRFEVEVGTEWVDEKTTSSSSTAYNLYIASGFTITF